MDVRMGAGLFMVDAGEGRGGRAGMTGEGVRVETRRGWGGGRSSMPGVPKVFERGGSAGGPRRGGMAGGVTNALPTESECE